MIFENSLMLPEIPAFYQQSPTVLNIMLDYFLWKIDEKDLSKFNMCSLLKLLDPIEKRDNIVLALKIVYLIHASHSFKEELRQQLLETILFN